MRYLLILFFTCTFLTAEAQTKSVLFIGNSYTAVNDLPNLIYTIALANGDTIYYEANTPGGSYFNAHKTNPTTLAKIASRDWDHVVLQEQSQLPALPLEIAGADYSPPSAADLCDLVRENDSCTEIVFYMTWGRKDGDASFCADIPEMCTYEGMQLLLRDAYLGFAEDNDASIAPAGMGWKAVIDDDPTIELYSGDGSHPNINGSYLTACIFYATLFQESPIGTTFHAGLTEELALYFQTIAHAIVFDSLDLWRIGIPSLEASYSEIQTDYFEYEFTCSSENADVWEWTINGESLAGEVVTYDFPGPGDYPVQLIVSNSCDTIIFNDTLTVEAAGIQEEQPAIKIYPNPILNVLTISNPQHELVEIYDIYGRKLDLSYSTEIIEINAEHWKSGTYIVRIGNAYAKVVKQ